MTSTTARSVAKKQCTLSDFSLPEYDTRYDSDSDSDYEYASPSSKSFTNLVMTINNDVVKKPVSDFPGIKLSTNTDGSKIYKTTWSQIKDLNIQNWILNRPPDVTRVDDMVPYLSRHNYVDGFIYLVRKKGKNGEKDVDYCYDGIHRYESLKKLYEGGHQGDHTILVHFTPLYYVDDVKYKFSHLNKCVPVPDIYSDLDKEKDVKVLVEGIVKYINEQYPQHFSSKNKPHVSHVNRDGFTTKLTTFVEQNEGMMHFSVEKMCDLLQQFNQLMSQRISSVKLTKKQRAKCLANGCFMFIKRNWEHDLQTSYLNGAIKIKR